MIQEKFFPVKNELAQGLSSLVGNTPMLAIDFLYKGKERTLYAKAEHLNMTGSIKDRMALNILTRALEAGVLKPGMPIYEATSGNTGISIAAIGRALGHKVTIFMPNWMSEERKNIIRCLGADIVLVSKEDGGFLKSIAMAEEAAATTNGFLPSQFSSRENVQAHYQTTAPEIWWQMRYRSLQPDAFIAGVGTGGTVMGVGQFLKEKNKEIKVYPLEPSNSPTLSTGYKVGKHRIQGISDDFIPPIVKLDELDEVVSVDDGDSIIMAQKLGSQLGLGVGISSGANFIGALEVQNRLGHDKIVVTVFADDNKKYLSTDLLRTEKVKKGFMSADIELLRFRSFKRVCHTCCDPLDCIESIYELDNVRLPHCPRRANPVG
jgi:cysteine synthase